MVSGRSRCVDPGPSNVRIYELARKQGIMAYVMAVIAERTAEFGARWVVTFVGKDNVSSIKGCARCAAALGSNPDPHQQHARIRPAHPK
jgi:hypothetical protein